MSEPALDYDYTRYCPSCGEWDRTIVAIYGWCSDCVAEHLPDIKLCVNCHTPFSNKSSGNQCWRCKWETYLRNNAERIEELLFEGLNFSQIRKILKNEHFRYCAVCNKLVQGGVSADTTRKHHFCVEHGLVRVAYHRRISAGMDPDKALVEAMNRPTNPGDRFRGANKQSENDEHRASTTIICNP